VITAVRFSRFEFSDEELNASGLDISGDEVRISFYSKGAVLPVHFHGKNVLMPWGNRTLKEIPRTGGCKIESLKAGKWQWLRPREAYILASCALVGGVWFQVRQGIEAVVVRDKAGVDHCYPLIRPSTHYFKIMTGSELMPALINQIL